MPSEVKYRHSPHLITVVDLFCNFDVKKKLTGKGNIKRTYKCEDKNTLARKIFLRYLYIMFTDFLEGDKVFTLPTRKYMEIRMRRIPQAQFISARKVGNYADVDILASNQMCYEAVITYKVRGVLIDSMVKVSKQLRKIVVNKVNTGYKYC